MADADAEALTQRLVELRQPVAHRQRGADRAVGVVLAGVVQAEHRHDRVADELLDDATVGGDDLLPGVEVRADDGARVLGVESARQCGEVDEVREQHRHELALLAGQLPLGALTTLTQRAQCGLDDVVTE